MFYNEQNNEPDYANIAFAIVLLLGVVIVGWMWLHPIYNVWQKGKAGEAQYKEAEQNRRIKILEAEAQNTATISNAEAKIKMSKAEAQAEIERAYGVAKANEIIASGLKGNEEYLRYLWINNIKDSNKEVIYVPTESQLPILEAGKR
jgi:regulator of protease activity HflC (stomatin/prohibitin superfamily)